MWKGCSPTSHLKAGGARRGARAALPLPAPTPPGNMRWPADCKPFISKL